MEIDRYTQYFAAGLAFFGSEAGWYVVTVTDCDTVIDGDNDGNNMIPYASREAAARYL